MDIIQEDSAIITGPQGHSACFNKACHQELGGILQGQEGDLDSQQHTLALVIKVPESPDQVGSQVWSKKASASVEC